MISLSLNRLSLIQRMIFALLCGGLATLTLPPFFWFILMLPAYSGLYLLLNSTDKGKHHFWTGWAFGLGYHASGLYWFANALLIDAEKFAWMIPFAVLGLPAILGIFYGLMALLWHNTKKRYPQLILPMHQALIFAVLWLGMELARGYLFTGFPWNLPASSWAGSLPMLQPLHFLGAYGYSFYTVLLAIMPAIAWLSRAEKPLLICLMMLILPFGYGQWRLYQSPTEYTDTTLKIVQPSISQQLKWRPEQRIRTIEKHLLLSKPKEGESQAKLIIWSESAYPYAIEPYSPPLQYITQKIVPPQSHLFTGAVRFDAEGNVYHGLSVVASDSSIPAQYDKIRLVPFGEFVPLRWLLPLQKITHGMKDFTPGKTQKIIALPDVPAVLPLICYEVIFPEMSQADADTPKPEWLLNLTNDGWYGESNGPYQHFAMARMRAVEQGLPMVRAANNGISAVIDPVGRIVASLSLNAVGVITHRLPKPLK